MAGRVVVDNRTGHAIHVTGCLGLFSVALSSGSYQPDVASASCAETLTVPAGISSYPVTVQASYLACNVGGPQGGFKACLPGSKLPPLPPGKYHATLFQDSQVVPEPPAIPVRVTPSKRRP